MMQQTQQCPGCGELFPTILMSCHLAVCAPLIHFQPICFDVQTRLPFLNHVAECLAKSPSDAPESEEEKLTRDAAESEQEKRRAQQKQRRKELGTVARRKRRSVPGVREAENKLRRGKNHQALKPPLIPFQSVDPSPVQKEETQSDLIATATAAVELNVPPVVLQERGQRTGEEQEEEGIVEKEEKELEAEEPQEDNSHVEKKEKELAEEGSEEEKGEEETGATLFDLFATATGGEELNTPIKAHEQEEEEVVEEGTEEGSVEKEIKEGSVAKELENFLVRIVLRLKLVVTTGEKPFGRKHADTVCVMCHAAVASFARLTSCNVGVLIGAVGSLLAEVRDRKWCPPWKEYLISTWIEDDLKKVPLADTDISALCKNFHKHQLSASTLTAVFDETTTEKNLHLNDTYTVASNGFLHSSAFWQNGSVPETEKKIDAPIQYATVLLGILIDKISFFEQLQFKFTPLGLLLEEFEPAVLFVTHVFFVGNCWCSRRLMFESFALLKIHADRIIALLSKWLLQLQERWPRGASTRQQTNIECWYEIACVLLCVSHECASPLSVVVVEYITQQLALTQRVATQENFETAAVGKGNDNAYLPKTSRGWGIFSDYHVHAVVAMFVISCHLYSPVYYNKHTSAVRERVKQGGRVWKAHTGDKEACWLSWSVSDMVLEGTYHPNAVAPGRQTNKRRGHATTTIALGLKKKKRSSRATSKADTNEFEFPCSD
jgi:hypothetical protein